MIGAGQLRTRLTLQAPVEIADGQGGVARSYANVSDVWAQVTLLDARKNIAADADGATVRVHILLRAPLGLTLQHRLTDDDQVYRIVGTRDDGQFIAVDAELRVK